MKQLIKIFLIFSFVMPLMLSAQKKDYSSEKGYVDFKDLSKYETGEKYMEVILEDNLLKLASKFAKHDDPELAELIANLKLVQVYGVEVNNENAAVLKNRVDGVNNMLMEKKWDRIVRMKDRGENVSVLINVGSGTEVNGLVVTVFDDNKEATFVNIVGKIDLETIGRLTDQWDIPHLDKVGKKRGN